MQSSSDKPADKTQCEQSGSIADVLGACREVLHNEQGENQFVFSLVSNLLAVMEKMETRLSVIESNTATLTSLTSKVNSINNDMVDVKRRTLDLEIHMQGNSNIIDGINKNVEKTTQEVKNIKRENKKVTSLQEDINRLTEENAKLNDKLIDLRCRSMKYNLLFTGIKENEDEDCEIKLKDFIKDEMNLIDDIQFVNVHRIGKKSKQRTRSIIARFVHYKDLDAVKKAAKISRASPMESTNSTPQR